jgi:hypothetical protein
LVAPPSTFTSLVSVNRPATFGFYFPSILRCP